MDSQNCLPNTPGTARTAFRGLVSRYVDLVYSTALRLVGGDTHRAEDVTQTVFVDLARGAPTSQGCAAGRSVASGHLLGARQLLNLIQFRIVNTNAMTRSEAVALFDQAFREQAGIEITHPATNRAVMRLRRR